jgi:hypothetical protein
MDMQPFDCGKVGPSLKKLSPLLYSAGSEEKKICILQIAI